MMFRIVFWDVLPCKMILHGSTSQKTILNSKKVFYIQKRIISIMTSTKRRASCRELFKKFNVLLLDSEFLLSLLSFTVDNM
jgi:hypothetical protein